MAKLHFKYGTVGSAKTLNLLTTAHSYKQKNKKVVLIKPKIDDRFGEKLIKTRAGLEAIADIIVEKDQEKIILDKKNLSCILVDEAQFLPVKVIEQLYEISYKENIKVICYGLKTDFRKNLFPASSRLLELADAIEELETICFYCYEKANFNLKLVDGKPTLEGPIVDLGCEEKYLPACSFCFEKQFNQGLKRKLIFTSGVFDILHAGHLEILNKSKELGNKLIVGINSDQSTKRLKGNNRPINNQEKRKKTLESLKFIDEVIIFEEDTPYELIKKTKPDVIVKGSDYTKETVVGNDLADVVIISNVEGFSTTSIITQINSLSKK